MSSCRDYLTNRRGKVLNYYFACLLFHCKINGQRDPFLLSEESIYLVYAHDEDEAATKAEMLGKDASHSYLNNKGETVLWKFVRIVSIHKFREAELG